MSSNSSSKKLRGTVSRCGGAVWQSVPPFTVGCGHGGGGGGGEALVAAEGSWGK